MKDNGITKSGVGVRQMVVLAMLTAVAYVCVVLVRLPIMPAAPFLDYEPKDCIIAIGGFLYGPLAAVAMSVVVSLVELFTISSTGWIGLLMNVLATVLFVCPAAVLYKKKRTLVSALIGLLIGIVLMTGGMLLWNYLITPLYMGMPRAAVAEMLLPVFLPFNLLKGGLNTALTLLLYKAVATALRRAKMLPEAAPAAAGAHRAGVLVWIGAAVVLATLVLILLVSSGTL